MVISKCVKFQEYFSGIDFIGLTFTNYTGTNHKEIEFEKKASTDFHCRVFPCNRNSFYWIYVFIQTVYRQFAGPKKINVALTTDASSSNILLFMCSWGQEIRITPRARTPLFKL